MAKKRYTQLAAGANNEIDLNSIIAVPVGPVSKKFTFQQIKDVIADGDATPIPITFSELQTAITNSTLVAGQEYVLTNFKTVYDQMDFDNTGSLKPVLATKMGAIEELYFFATSTNAISSTVYSKQYPKDKIQYDVSYSTTLINSAPAFGRISERIDEWNNRTDFDHREIKFIRYDDGAGNFNVINDNTNTSQEFLTFGTFYNTNTGEFIVDNHRGDFYKLGLIFGQEYSNIIMFGQVLISNKMSSVVFNQTFSSEVGNSTFSGRLLNNTFLGNIGRSTFSGSLFNNTFSGNVENSTFSSYIVNNTFSGRVENSTFSGNLGGNTFSGNVRNCTFSGLIDSKTMPNVFDNDYETTVFLASDGNVYYRYFDGLIDKTILIP